ncbi:MAG: GlcG/HbpS family heme-binding protein [Usitatibacter sp.]
MRPSTAIALALVALSGTSFAQGVANEPTISADAALDAATAALAQCRKDGGKVSVTVVDASGRMKAMVRDDAAAPHSAEHSFRKAYTALTYRMPSAEVGKRAAETKGVAIGPQLLPNMTTSAGGVPIKAGGATIGAIGVSGTPSSAGGGEGDAKCAQAGLARIMK